MKKLTLLLLLSALPALANPSLPRILPTNSSVKLPIAKLQQSLGNRFPGENYREVRAQIIFSDKTGGRPDHALVYLFAKNLHRVDFAAVKLDAQYNLLETTLDYQLTTMDHAQQPRKLSTPVCPDPSIQFLSVCPNDNSLEINVTQDVAKAAEAAGLKTKTLLIAEATSETYLNYMSCPAIVGNFYDGDANTGVLATNDGEISASEFTSKLKGAFRKKVTNIWLACEAYNNPMLKAIRDTDQSQKYAAGINDLQVGPSDYAAACAMKAAIAGKPMTAAFKTCYDQLDTPSDKWGFGGKGSDLFGQ